MESGCTAISKGTTISCECSHLTTFAVIQNIDSRCSQFTQSVIYNDKWDYVNLTFASAFAIIFMYILWRFIDLWQVGAFKRDMARFFLVFSFSLSFTPTLIRAQQRASEGREKKTGLDIWLYITSLY